MTETGAALASQAIDGVPFVLREPMDFSWLGRVGRVFRVFDRQDSGNLCFGVERAGERLFVKFAGARTAEYDGPLEEAVSRLRAAGPVYEALRQPNLIELLSHGPAGEGYALVFRWARGECLHAHWNFERTPKYTHPDSPNVRFRTLPLTDKLRALDTILEVHRVIAGRGYLAVDLYDGSVLYDFDSRAVTVCDIDLYRPGPFVNTMGRMWGSSRFLSPEERQLGAVIDEATNVYTLGAMAFELLGENKTRSLKSWTASEALYRVASRAVEPERERRYPTVRAFCDAWRETE